MRRVYERFGDVFSQYEGLYWSHFQAALDWDDAEMWLEGAVQNEWSVSEHASATLGDDGIGRGGRAARRRPGRCGGRRRLFGGRQALPDAHRCRAADDLVTDDYTTDARSPAGPDFGDEDDVPPRRPATRPTMTMRRSRHARLRPNLCVRSRICAELPEDLTAAFEAFQLAILRHKSEHWQAVSLEDVLGSLDALKALALAPAE